jgi:hypothetical protein
MSQLAASSAQRLFVRGLWRAEISPPADVGALPLLLRAFGFASERNAVALLLKPQGADFRFSLI